MTPLRAPPGLAEGRGRRARGWHWSRLRPAPV